MQQAVVQVVGDLPAWAENLLLLTWGALATTVAFLIYDRIKERGTGAAITAVRRELSVRLDKLEREFFGLDGNNGVRGDTKALKKAALNQAILLVRIAEQIDLNLTAEEKRELTHID